MLAIVYATPPIEGLSHQGKAALGVCAFAIISWMTQALDEAQSGFCIVILLVVLGAAKLGTALNGYATNGLWIVTLGMIMGTLMNSCGVSKRMAFYMVSKAGKSAKNLYWAVSLITLIMSFFIPSLGAKTLLVMPLVTQMGLAFGAEKGKSSLVKGLLFVVASAGTMYCVGIMTANAANPITASLVFAATGYQVSWAEWFKLGFPPALLMGLGSTFIVYKMFPPEVEDITTGQVEVARILREMGPMSLKEKYALFVFLATLLLWATDSLTGLNPTLTAMMSVVAMILPGPQQILNWKETEKGVAWKVFVVYGAGLSMGSILVSSGAAKWLAATFFYPMLAFDLRLQAVIFIWLITGMQVLFTGAGPKTTALTPVVLAHAIAVAALPSHAGMQVSMFAILVGMNMLHQYLLPVTNLPNMIATATEEVTGGEIIKVGVVMTVYSAVFATVSVYTYWTWIGMF
jgi:solute carrier family 13 (sodium-dependent dicarboxylate transporter), member 2/3/5